MRLVATAMLTGRLPLFIWYLMYALLTVCLTPIRARAKPVPLTLCARFSGIGRMPMSAGPPLLPPSRYGQTEATKSFKNCRGTVRVTWVEPRLHGAASFLPSSRPRRVGIELANALIFRSGWKMFYICAGEKKKGRVHCYQGRQEVCPGANREATMRAPSHVRLFCTFKLHQLSYIQQMRTAG